MKTECSVFNFWKDNKLTGFFQLTDKELIQKFSEWMKTKDVAWLDYYTTQEVVSVFVSKGLGAVGNSENNFSEYRSMVLLLKPYKRKFIDGVKSVG